MLLYQRVVLTNVINDHTSRGNSPHEFLQEVNRVSRGKFGLEKQGDPVEFFPGWLLNRLHKKIWVVLKWKCSISLSLQPPPSYPVHCHIGTIVQPPKENFV